MPRPTLRWAIVAWLIVLSVITARILVKPQSHSVFPIFVNAGQNWLHGATLYGELKPGLDQFRYAPAVAAGFAPWTLLSPGIGEALWRWANAAVFLGGLAVWLR